MSLIVLPTARIHCACGERLAPHPTAAHRMGLTQLLQNAGRCGCGAWTLREVRRVTGADGCRDVGHMRNAYRTEACE